MPYNAQHNLNDLHAEIQRIAAGLDDVRPLLLVWAQAGAKRARTKARAKGGRRFWAELARSVNVRSVSSKRVSVYTSHVAAAQKEFGGEIRPKNAKALTIPITEEARGKRASEFESGGRDLFVLDRDSGDTVGILGYSEGESFHPLFVLRTRVVQQPDPWWITEREAAEIGLDEARRFVQRTIGGQA